MKKINKIAVCFRKDGKKIEEQNSLMELFSLYGKLHGVTVVKAEENEGVADLVVSGGGDGTFLDAARIAFILNVPVAGINIGHMGFLTEINPEETSMIEKLFTGNFSVNRRMMVDVTVSGEKRNAFNYTALNEVLIHRETLSGMVSLRIEYNDERLPEYKGDGVMISTPTGSTAYNLSCNGPIIYPTDNSIVINAIAPHALTHRPIVLPADEGGVIKVHLKQCEAAVLLCDGKSSADVFKGDTVTIQKSKASLQVVSNPDRSFFDILSEKLHFGRRM
ncbi:MAG: NAD(+)/NADH kinase [bacterium]